MSKKQNNKKGSVLIFTLFVMMLTLITGISLIATSLSGRRSSISSGKSVNAFQIADSGLEASLASIKDATGDIGDFDALDGDCISGGDPVMEDTNISGGNYKVWFYNDADNKLGCSDAVSEISRIKSVGVYRNTTRSVETTFASP